MAAHAKDRAAHVAEGTWRADRHASRVDAYGVAPVDADSVLWKLLRDWQDRFVAARDDVEQHGARMDSKGQTVINPSVKMMAEASSQIRELAKVLGIGPLNRSRLGAVPDVEPDDDSHIPPPKVRHGKAP